MAAFEITGPDGSVYEVNAPDGATEDEVLSYAKAQFSATSAQPAAAQQPQTYDPTEGMSTSERLRAGIGMGMTRAVRGVGQVIGAVDQSEIDEAHRIEAPLERTGAGRAGNFVGSVASYAPTALIPGANTIAGAALIGGASSALMTEGGLKDRAIAGAGGAVGAGIGVGVGRGASYLLKKSASKATEKAAEHAVRNQTIRVSREAGYKIPLSEMTDDGIMSGVAESFAGKAAMGQSASKANQRVTNTLARKAIGLAGKGQISPDDLAKARTKHFAIYKDAENLSPDTKEALQLWRQANNDARDWTKFYRRSADPSAQLKAKAARADAETYLSIIEQEAQRLGKSGLAGRLAASRKELAKIGSVENALNDETGDVLAVELAKMADRGVPLSAELKKIATFGGAFPKYAQPPKQTGMIGTSLLNWPAAAGLGYLHPAAAVVPFLRPAARGAMLSNSMQRMAAPSMNPGATRAALAPLVTTPSRLAGMAYGADSTR